jgi:beta-lactamase class A
MVLVVLVGAACFLNYASGGEEDLSGRPGEDPDAASRGAAPADSEKASAAESARELVPEQPPDSPEEAAYLVVAPELPGVSPESIKGVYRSNLDPSWASVHIVPSGEEKAYVVFVRRTGDSWEAKKSIRADEPDYPENDLVYLDEVPKDLVEYLYPENLFAAEAPEPRKEKVERQDLPRVGPAEFPPPDLVTEGVPESERERVEQSLEEVREKIEGYEGVAGVYVQDLDGGWGYGVRPDETFFSASIIKVPIMVAVYRDIDKGKLSLNDTFETQDEDWASGAGWLQWHSPGTSHTVEDYLYMMMTQSDNVAANALLRKVGGPERVNEVARSLGAENTVLYQKVSSERAAVPALDNRTTARDMATMMEKIAAGEAASPLSCRDMIDIMFHNELGWLEAGLPDDVAAATKAGWLYEVFDEAGIVKGGERPYVVVVLTKYGPGTPDEGGTALIEEISKNIWEAQGNS